MERQAVQSSNIVSVGYEPATRIMEVEFKSGGVYKLSNIAPDQYEAFMQAESLGKFYAEHFRERRDLVKVR